MTVFVGPLFSCTGPVADRIGIPEGRRVCWLTADRDTELRGFAAAMGLPEVRMFGHGPMARYVITGLERNRAQVRGAELTSAALAVAARR